MSSGFSTWRLKSRDSRGTAVSQAVDKGHYLSRSTAYSLSCCGATYFVIHQCADNLTANVISAVPAVFRSPLRYVDESAMMHQMNRLGVARRVDDPERLAAGELVSTAAPPQGD